MSKVDKYPVLTKYPLVMYHLKLSLMRTYKDKDLLLVGEVFCQEAVDYDEY